MVEAGIFQILLGFLLILVLFFAILKILKGVIAFSWNYALPIVFFLILVFFVFS